MLALIGSNLFNYLVSYFTRVLLLCDLGFSTLFCALILQVVWLFNGNILVLISIFGWTLQNIISQLIRLNFVILFVLVFTLWMIILILINCFVNIQIFRSLWFADSWTLILTRTRAWFWIWRRSRRRATTARRTWRWRRGAIRLTRLSWLYLRWLLSYRIWYLLFRCHIIIYFFL